ncbi:NAD(P)-binding domain-containing protein, partial [Burkholderia sp. SIMBA_057]
MLAPPSRIQNACRISSPAGYALHLYNRSRTKAEALLAAGATWHDTPAAVAAASDVVLTIVGVPD